MEEDIPQHFLDQLDEAYRQLEEKDRDLMMAAQFGKQLLDAKEELEEQAENLKSQLADVTNKLGNERSQHSVVVRSFQEKESSNEATIASLTKQVQTWKEKSLSDALDRSGLSQAGAGSAGFSSNCDSDAAERIAQLEKAVEEHEAENEKLRHKNARFGQQVQQLKKELASAHGAKEASITRVRDLEADLEAEKLRAKEALRDDALEAQNVEASLLVGFDEMRQAVQQLGLWPVRLVPAATPMTATIAYSQNVDGTKLPLKGTRVKVWD
eukprot:INCI4821.1.p1 GENE.INCI4821.1~~INCI4821.1.p1  ORF type:complete len:269 (+),score=65.32 INCI4821.1:194-1000(+)